MLEAKINKEIKEIKERVVFGLSLRQLIFSAIAIVIGVAIYFFFRDYLDMELLTWAIIIAAAPFAALGFESYQGMPAEKIALELLESYVVNKKTIENKPRNTYKLMIKVMDEDTDEVKKAKKKRGMKNAIITAIVFAIMIAGMVFLSHLQSQRNLEAYVAETVSELSQTYDKLLYQDSEWRTVERILNEMKAEMKEQQNMTAAQSCKENYEKQLSGVKTYGQISADAFASFYADNKTILAHTELQKIYQEEYDKIKNSKGAVEVDEAYESAIKRINEEIRSFNSFL